MGLRSNRKSPVFADPVPVNRTRFGPSSNLKAYSPPTATTYSPGLLLIVPKRRPGPLKVDDVRATGWLDVMKSSSPTDLNLNKDLGGNGVAAGEVESAYCSWLLKYPSAISSFNQLAKCAEGKQIALFLDYDGTLSPIVNNPDSAFMSHAMRAAVKHVADYFPTAIVSGRSRDKVYEFVGLTELYYAGSHGMDIMGPVRDSESDNDHSNSIRSTDKQGKDVNHFQPASKFIPIIDEVSNLLLKSIKGVKGATIENNKFCVSVHYRLVDEQDWVIVGQIVHDILKDYPELRVTYGRKVLEVRPIINWNKGKAVEFLLDSLGLNNSENVLPIYVGDDQTDEDAFQVLKEANRGFGILVSSAPKESSASYSLRDPTEVMHFLKSLVAWKTSTAI